MPTRPAVLERSVEIAAPVQTVFEFHLDPRNAALIAPAGTRVVSVEGAVPVEAGHVVTLRMRAPAAAGGRGLDGEDRERGAGAAHR